MSPALVVFGAMLFASVVSLARAELAWTQKKVVLEPEAGAHEAVATFEFTNRGSHPIRIQGVQSGCECTAAVIDRDRVNPGESGRIEARYHTEDKQGRQTVALTVMTDEGGARGYDLTLEVNLKEFAAVSPRSHAWRVGEEPVARHFTVTLASGFEFVGAESNTSHFRAEVGAVAPGRAEFSVQPRDLWEKRSGIIRVKVAKDRRVVDLLVRVRVQ